jgi:murein L,D-transpeptidase YafK
MEQDVAKCDGFHDAGFRQGFSTHLGCIPKFRPPQFGKVASFIQVAACKIMCTHAPNRADQRPAERGAILAYCTRRSWFLGLGAALWMGLAGQSPADSISPTPRADSILIIKHERKLYVLHDDFPLRTYRIALGLSPTGAKEHAWDFRTPEGSYIIDFRRENSHYFKALHISYPSAADLKRSSALHRSAGGDIFIHGEPNRPTKPDSYYKTRDWTNGCIALADEDLQDLWDLTAGPTPVEIVP